MRFIWAVASLAVASHAASWDSNNDPKLFSDSYEYKLENLPTNGSTAVPAWSETYWPSYQSGIAHRWNTDNPQDFHYHLYSKAELLKLQKANNFTVIQSLSPAEKFDIFKGRYDYPTVKEEWQRTHANDPSWEGICHGWSPASLEYASPNNVTLVNKDGVEVYFGASDIKGLLSFYAGQVDTSASVKFIGQRCDSDLDANPKAAKQPECADLDAAAYHIVLANQLGLLKQGFVVDRYRGDQVWNQPLNSFRSTIGNFSAPRANATEGTNSSVMVHTDMTYSSETEPQWTAHEPYQTTEQYKYFLDLDAEGNIIGGLMKTYDRVDFAWTEKSSPFFGYWADLKEIYVNSTQDASHPNVVNALTVSEDHLFAATHESAAVDAGSISFHDYANLEHRSWSIGFPESSTMAAENYVTMITFSNFETEKYRDQLSIFEGVKGAGPLVSVMHGAIPETNVVTVQGPGALLVFKADQQNNKFGGFDAAWKVVPAAEL